MAPRRGGLVVLFGLALLGVAGAKTRCRLGPGASHTGCGLPDELANFQGYHECADAVQVGKPATVEEVQEMVKAFPRVKAAGVGASWWTEQFCAGDDANSINIVTTELKSTLDFMAAPVDPKQWADAGGVPPDFPIQVDEDAQTVRVAAGITQRRVLDYLAAYTHWKEPAGWVLPAPAWFQDQTIAGAVATAAHGSSMRYSSLSGQLRGLKIVLANGTLLELSPDSNRHLYLAAGASVGRLGVLTEVTISIVPQQNITRTNQEMSFQEFAQQIKDVQDAYNAAKAAGDEEAMKAALYQLDETQAFWAFPSAIYLRADFEHLARTPDSVLLNAFPAEGEPGVQALSEPVAGVVEQVEKEPVAGLPRMLNGIAGWNSFYINFCRTHIRNGTFPSRQAYISMAAGETAFTSTFAPYEQLEVAIPLERAGSCLMEVGNEVYGPQRLWEGFRVPSLTRFTTQEDYYLSPATDGPLMWINMEDYLSRSSGVPNDKFHKVVSLFRERCGARLHWGKAGWPEHAKCFDGGKEYPNTWGHFGCAVQELDPQAKFASEWDGWVWAATRDGAPVPFASCCSADGFDPACRLAPRTGC
ncbi:L-gulonolactone oxidase [Micractinium conductrix]|uniref:L-gulonolactone oxidase n=1 Tax=Micractinium conductrix TaxID=554055 RepID=A0A2P6VI33_9CHLO|nr:L-gulonolactone oxidase [Micractinium conductrix]|eukprot:PSC73742.1 L-gulonolactone oxidase [Micractinium conductrix]